MHAILSEVNIIGSHKVGHQFRKPICVGVIDNLIVILEESSERIQITHEDGSIVKYIGDGHIKDPRCMAIGQDSKIYICSTNKILIFCIDGALLDEICVKFRMPVCIVHDSQNNRLLISDNKQNCIYQCVLGGDNVVTVLIGGYGTKLGQINHPHGLALDNDNNLFVSDQDNRRILKFKSNGLCMGTILMNSYPTFVHYDKKLDFLFVGSGLISTQLLYIHKIEIYKNEIVYCQKETMQDARGMVTKGDKLFVCGGSDNCLQVYQILNS